MTLLRDARDDLIVLIRAASAANEMPPEFIEKDYWVTEVLRAVAMTTAAHVVFKGGTSLSKSYGLIRRFSEDVDVLVVPQADISQEQRNALLKSICKKTQGHLQLDDGSCLVEERGAEEGGALALVHGHAAHLSVTNGRRSGTRGTGRDVEHLPG